MPNVDATRKAVALLRDSRKTVALTGAGISTPSGIPDFRSPASGLWESANPMVVASIYGFKLKPKAFYEWIRPLAATMRQAEPNPAHIALAKMEAAGYLSAVITQNIDRLHTLAGSQEVYELHGEMSEATCMRCSEVYETGPYIDKLVAEGGVPADKAARSCDVMLVVGSSLLVTPAAGLPRVALSNGARLIVVNNEVTYADAQADAVIRDDVAVVLPHLASELGVA
jgi:NAD-dependent deacetylase